MRFRWFLALPVAVLALVVGGTWTYINVIRDDAPARLSVSAGTENGETAEPAQDTRETGTAADSEGLDGTWTATSGSQAGYRVDEILFGQNATAVGRTTGVTGEMAIAGSTVESATITVDMAGIKSDETRRDNQFRGRIMDVATYPTATFALTTPVELPSSAAGAAITVPATGQLTLRGTTKTVTFNLEAVQESGAVKVSGSLPIVFAEWGIPSPSFGPVSTEDHGELEFLVVFTREA